jgi:hypothetical protein
MFAFTVFTVFTFTMFVFAVFAATLALTKVTFTDLQINELSATILGRGSGVVSLFAVFTMFAFTVLTFTMFVFAVFTATLALTKVTFRDGMSNDGCNGSSSKNECDGKFDLNHFE